MVKISLYLLCHMMWHKRYKLNLSLMSYPIKIKNNIVNKEKNEMKKQNSEEKLESVIKQCKLC